MAKKGETLALERAQAGDPESMYIYYRFTNNTEWVEKAANAGYARAQFDFWQTIWKKNGHLKAPKKPLNLNGLKK